MASPHVAGTVALMLAHGVEASDVKSGLTKSAKDLGTGGFDNIYGNGLVQADGAVFPALP